MSLSILALVHRVPYPPDKGEKIRAYHELRYLASRGHHIDLATFADAPEDRAHGPALSALCREVCVVPKDRRLSRLGSALALPVRLPLSVGYFRSRRLRARVEGWLATRRYDVALCYSSPMAEYVRGARPFGRVMDFVDVDSDKWRQYAEHTTLPMRAVYQLEARLLARYEREVAEEFDASLFVSAREAELFRRLAPRARQVLDVPNGVDHAYFGATTRRPREAHAPLLVFVGQMDYFANVDGVCWFADEIFPQVQTQLPGATFRVVGRAPTEAVRRLANRPGIEVTGAVPDVRQHLGEATLGVAPLRIARGIQNKVLEGMAARVPMVVTPAALEGIDGEDRVHLRVAAEPAGYTRAIVELARDEAAARLLAERAEALVRERYAWDPAMGRLEAVLSACAARPGA